MFNFIIQHSPLLYLTQSLWRDEAFSLFMAAKPIPYFVKNLNFEPPFYYLLLHFWEKVFGQSEIAGRSLSLIAFAGATVVVIFWAKKLFKKHWLSWWLPVFFLWNPMLLYYGMELRTYGWYTFFATLSLFAYDQKKWAWWVLATVLGFYTHSFLVIVPFAQIAHYAITRRKELFTRGFLPFVNDPFVRSAIVAGLLIAPWSVKLFIDSTKLKSSWYYPVNFNLATSALGNLFIGYEGTPWYLWGFTKVLSAGILAASYIAYMGKKTQRSTGLFLSQVYLPLIVVIGISFVKPIYVNRYMIAVPVAEIFLVALAIYAIKNAKTQKIVAACCLLFVLLFNFWYPDKHAKLDIRSTMRQVNALKTPKDVVIADNPLIFFETMYYSSDQSRVFLYNPEGNPFPWYVGDTIVDPKQMVRDFPPYPTRAFVVHQDGTFDVVYTVAVSQRPMPKRL